MGLLYDSTINEHWTGDGKWPTSKDGGARLWPYTMDSGIPQNCAATGPDGECDSVRARARGCDDAVRLAGRLWERGSLVPCSCSRHQPCSRNPMLPPPHHHHPPTHHSLLQNERHPGLWEVPVWVLQTSKYPMDAYAMDPGGDVFALLKINFDAVSEGGRGG